MALCVRVRTLCHPPHPPCLPFTARDLSSQIEELLAEKAASQALDPSEVPTAAQGRADRRICFVYLNTGTCGNGAECKFRHIEADHPDAVADRIRRGEFSKIPRHVNPMLEHNPNVIAGEIRVCHEFFSSKKCSRSSSCTFRHLLPGHPDMPLPGGAAGGARAVGMSAAPHGAPPQQLPWLQPAQPQQPQPYSTPQQVVQAAAANAAAAQAAAAAGGYGSWQTGAAQQHAAYANSAAYAAAGAYGAYPPQPYGAAAGAVAYSHQPSAHAAAAAAQQQQPPPGGVVPTMAPPDGRICFPYLNRGKCQHGAMCRFRHLAQDHPDAIADRLRTGHVHRIPGMATTQAQPPAAGNPGNGAVAQQPAPS